MSQPYIDFAFVKENASFERVLTHYKLESRGSGVQRSVRCPFHPDKRPSCRVELDKKIFHCFSCEASGNILEFVAKLEDADLRAAAEKIADICEIPLAAPRQDAAKNQKPGKRRSDRKAQLEKPRAARPTPKPKSPQPDNADEDARAALTRADIHGEAKPVNAPLTFALKLDAAHPYLVERGVSAEVVAQFGLGYCSRGVMAARVCIPIHNDRGELVAYAGRWPGEPPEGVERYLLPKRFEKSRVLFNLHRVSDAEHVVLVEGYWSVFRLHALGVPVAALMGSSVSEAQLALLRERGTRYVTLLLDGDDAGRKARDRALPDLASAFFVRAPVLPDREKPDTLGEAELRQLVALFP
jgi:DNA primase